MVALPGTSSMMMAPTAARAAAPAPARGGMFGGLLDDPRAALALTIGPALMAYGFQQPGLASIGPQMMAMNQRSKERAADAEMQERELALQEAEARRQAELRERTGGMFGSEPGGMFSTLTPDQMAIAQAMAVDDPMAALEYAGGLVEPTAAQDPFSRIGKLQADLDAGRITPEQYQVGVSAIDRPLVSMAPGETAEARAVGEWQAQQYTGLQDAAQAARQQNTQLDTLDQLLENVYTGAGGEQVQAARRIGAMFGLDVEGVGDADAARAIANQMALELRNPAGGAGMPGAMSDRDREFLASMTPNLGMTKEGRETLIAVRRRTNNRSIEVARLARDYRRENGLLDEGFYDMLDDRYGDQNMFDDLQQYSAPMEPTAPATTRLRFDSEGNLIE